MERKDHPMKKKTDKKSPKKKGT